ncbi:hypothetical protein [Roseovarius sp.]|uniref:hypothetical protein n=1 Tax=Roseovarius sp. TaxID=1486281 RepID=UPI000C477289|nr:hypothetical protein [Roseovarius sp.]MAO27281.1 hypothetical protein [Roseovarius sp.]MAZ20922.1 hypothetical protein [Roseovarius sp.]
MKSFVTLFDETYDQPDCRSYYQMVHALGYRNHFHAIPLFLDILSQLKERRGLRAAQVLDFASSYGIVAATMRYGVTVTEFLDRYQSPEIDALGPEALARDDRGWLGGRGMRAARDRYLGMDVSEAAIAYGVASGVFDAGSAEDLAAAVPSADLAARLAEIDLIVECGSVAHLMGAATRRLLDATAARKPWIVTSPVRGNERAEVFALLRARGYHVETCGLPPFVHRRFSDAAEQRRAIEIAQAAGHETDAFEAGGAFYAQLYLARPVAEADAPITFGSTP